MQVSAQYNGVPSYLSLRMRCFGSAKASLITASILCLGKQAGQYVETCRLARWKMEGLGDDILATLPEWEICDPLGGPTNTKHFWVAKGEWNIFLPRIIIFSGAQTYNWTIIGYELRGSILNIAVLFKTTTRASCVRYGVACLSMGHHFEAILGPSVFCFGKRTERSIKKISFATGCSGHPHSSSIFCREANSPWTSSSLLVKSDFNTSNSWTKLSCALQ